jgi:alkanesulfonate monooxygenase SsuD/methylene tetrahydromethanopterin reductase-like flavin-dependent oxidoreductase (luciferase family)
MELCVMIEGQEGVSWQEWLAVAHACEEHGVASLFRSDHYLPLDGQHEREALDAWGTICALAAATTTLRLGTLVSPATFRPPSVLAKLYATADEVSGGRVSLGLGAGWHEDEHRAFGFPFGPTRERIEVFGEQLEIVRGLCGPGPFQFEGSHYTLGPVDPQPKPSAPWIIVGGAAGPKSVALAARFADEYNTVFATVDECRERRAAVDEAWRQANGHSAPRFSLMTGAVIGRSQAEVDARQHAIGERRDEPDWEPGTSWIHGTLDEARVQLDALAEAGVDRVMLQLLLHEDLEQIELIGRELSA